MSDTPRTEAHTHCWHTPNVSTTLASWPPQHEEVCCHCGARQWVRDEPPQPPPGHGPYHPDVRPKLGVYFGGNADGR